METRFPWETLRSTIGGRSAIDVPRLHCRDKAGAEEFLECYGYDWNRVSHREELTQLRENAVDFIEDQLLDGGRVLEEVRRQDDARELLVWASAETSTRQQWACALLRVAHTLAHTNSPFNERYGDQIRQQIFQRFEPHLRYEDDLVFLGHDDDAIPLDSFTMKPLKPIESVAMKLLHKVENVAEDIFDRFGVRFVTRERFDALLVVKYLREHNVFMFANVKPSRSRNTLVDIHWLEDLMHGLDAEVASGALDESERLSILRQAVADRGYPTRQATESNVYSAASYHSIQFTCRQMIRVPERGGEMRFFFPFEVQITDTESYALARSGYAAHDQYKARQREAVRRRVLGRLLDDR